MNLLNLLTSPVLLPGDDTVALRDPAAIWHKGELYLYYTKVVNLPEGARWTIEERRTADLKTFTPPRQLFPFDPALNYSSPGNIVRDGDDFVLCFQTYCTENGEKYGNDNCRLFIARSRDLETWSEPEWLAVKGDDVSREDAGRMIDPYLIRHDGLWWCFYKQNGISLSTSPDLRHWQYRGRVNAGENPCILPVQDGYLMFHAPHNGIGVLKSADLTHWEPFCQDFFLGQESWNWGKGRVTAAFVMDLRSVPQFGRYVMLFHGSGPEDEETMFTTNASIAIAWSDDLITWHWPGQ